MAHHDSYGALEVCVVAFLDDLVKVMALFKCRLDRLVDGIVVAKVKMVACDDGAARYGDGVFNATNFFDDQLLFSNHIFEEGFAEEIRDFSHEFAGKLFDCVVHFARLYRSAGSVLLDVVVKAALLLVFFDARQDSQAVFSSHGKPPRGTRASGMSARSFLCLQHSSTMI